MSKKKHNEDVEDQQTAAPEEHDGSAQQADGADTADATPEDESAVVEEEETIESLHDKLQGADDQRVRLLAEFDNYKRRTSREYSRMVEAANEGLMLDLTEVRENLERALKAESTTGDVAVFEGGVRMIFTRLDEILGKHGLEPFGEDGEEFDPAVHDAMLKSPHADIAEDHIAQVVERGYRLKGHVIKHARVIVSAGPAEQGPGEDEQTKTQESATE